MSSRHHHHRAKHPHATGRRAKHTSRRKNKAPSLLWRLVRYGLLALGALILIDTLYLATLWPDWEALAKGAVPKSKFIERYEAQRNEDKKLPPLRWQPVAMQQIAPIMGRAVIVAEDSRFYVHEGIDTEAIQEAMEKNMEKGKVVYGASTISQQTVKNMFLSGSRDYLRKWHELVLTWSMERNLSKRRILEIYLNVAEFGPGIYGVEAASRYYWGIPASALRGEQAVQLAASLPSPKKHNPQTASRDFHRRVARITRHMKLPEQPASDAPGEAPAPATPLVEPFPADGAPATATPDPVPDTPTATPQ